MKREVLFDGLEKAVEMSFPCYFKSTEEYDDGKEVTYWAFNDVDDVEIIVASTSGDEISASYETDTTNIAENYDHEFFSNSISVKGLEFNKFKKSYINLVDKIKSS